MADTNQRVLNITPEELQNLMKAAISAAVSEATRLNPLEQKQVSEDIEKHKRRTLRSFIEASGEEQKRWNQQHNCSHWRDKQTGEQVPKGQGVPRTGGQAHEDGTLTLLCMRCNTVWRWKATPQELAYAHETGMLGWPPPDVSRCLNKDSFIDVRPEPLNVEELTARLDKQFALAK